MASLPPLDFASVGVRTRRVQLLLTGDKGDRGDSTDFLNSLLAATTPPISVAPDHEPKPKRQASQIQWTERVPTLAESWLPEPPSPEDAAALPAAPLDPKDRRCILCGKVVVNGRKKGPQRRHVESKHGKRAMYSCRYCPVVSINRSGRPFIRQHVMTQHPEEFTKMGEQAYGDHRLESKRECETIRRQCFEGKAR